MKIKNLRFREDLRPNRQTRLPWPNFHALPVMSTHELVTKKNRFSWIITALAKANQSATTHQLPTNRWDLQIKAIGLVFVYWMYNYLYHDLYSPSRVNIPCSMECVTYM